MGVTSKVDVHYTCGCGAILTAQVYRSIDVSAQPELRQRMLGDDPEAAINRVTCPHEEVSVQVEVPVIYHDPESRVFLLVLPENARVGELAARAKLLLELDADTAAVPDYVRDFQVVFGMSNLTDFLSARAEEVVKRVREADAVQELRRAKEKLAAERTELETKVAEFELLHREFEHRHGEFIRHEKTVAQREAELENREAEIERRKHELDERARGLQAAESALADRIIRQREQAGQSAPAAASDKTQVVVRPSETRAPTEDEEEEDSLFPYDESTKPISPLASVLAVPSASADEGRDTIQVAAIDPGEAEVLTELDASEAEVLYDGEVMVADQHPTEERERANASFETSIEPWLGSGEDAIAACDDTGTVHVAVCADAAAVAMLLGSGLDVRVQLHRLRAFPIVVVAVATHESFSGTAGAPNPVACLLDIGNERDRAVLDVLARQFAFSLDIYDSLYALQRRRTVTASLEENVRLVYAAAEEHLESIPGKQRSFRAAVAEWADAGYDRYGREHAERGEFREEKLTDLKSARNVRRAIAIADRFTNPKRDDYLFMLRGYSRQLWREQRKAVLLRAIKLGIWMGKRLAPVAIEEGLAESKRDLIQTLQQNFTESQADPETQDLDPDAASDNWTALTAEAAALDAKTQKVAAGKISRRRRRVARSTPIGSAGVPAVSGTIPEATRADALAKKAHNQTTAELLEQLGDSELRVEACIELARRREISALGPFMAALAQMNRTDAVRVLSAAPSFGDPATSALIEGLGSHKGFLRQGCALALAILRNEAALEALGDLVISEPTPIWKEVARGIGTIGPQAIMPLASRMAASDDEARERVAWTLAHVASRGGKAQVQQLAGGRDPLAASVARRALELVNSVKTEDLQVRGHHTPKEQTVNRAFSRRFFQALEASSPVVDVSAGMDAIDLSSPAMILDEADLLEATDFEEDDAAEMLDESDLIPT